MNDAVLIALIVGVVPMASTIILSVLNNRFGRQRQEADWAHADKAAREQTVKLDQIEAQAKATHVFLNADKTAGLRRTLVLTETLLVSLRETLALNKSAGRRGSKAAADQIKALALEVDALTAEIALRDKQTKVADATIAAAK